MYVFIQVLLPLPLLDYVLVKYEFIIVSTEWWLGVTTFRATYVLNPPLYMSYFMMCSSFVTSTSTYLCVCYILVPYC